MTPTQHYLAGVARGEWQDDAAQRAVLVELDRIHAALSRPREQGLFARIKAHFQAPVAVQGLYLWGGVGRGKTFLIDLFFENLPIVQKKRIHFHRFMREMQALLKQMQGREDPLVDIAEQLSREFRVLCLDEFFVSDIGDAMILGGLLQRLFERGVTLVTTSNTAPPNLYRDGLQRERFLPAIAAIQAQCRVLEIVSAQDWRLRALTQARVFHSPLGHDAERALQHCFHQISHGVARAEKTLEILDRDIPVEYLAEDVVWFGFPAMCEGPRAVADYIEIGKDFGTVIVSGVPQFTPMMEDAARRFIEMVDEFYDRHVKLILSAAVPIVDLYDGDRLRAEFSRTESRLIEMQSEAYLALPHRP
ncbi:cell division protein ZapE [Tahibacter amnicola]|uniref:Cell division protein ZapE n=1 Tax=Tahibacter amnicola TaxID=2976241 RepID=A0ABY6BE91_9GAMM|nr:cell division protein ZapE [Tahibacter amnicola]UXI68102.1 cell division protein ZapE [Tahibacter amnicola]